MFGVLELHDVSTKIYLLVRPQLCTTVEPATEREPVRVPATLAMVILDSGLRRTHSNVKTVVLLKTLDSI